MNSIINETIIDGVDILTVDEITRSDVQEAFHDLKLKDSKGPDGIPQSFFKEYSQFLIDPLMHIFNLSLKSGKYPTVWKESFICPIPKIPMTKKIIEYRPISLLCVAGKIFEGILHKKIIAHILPFVSVKQYGFLNKMSTTTNLINFKELIVDAFDKKSQLDVLYTDFCKAFDKVDVEILLRKLRRYGFSIKLLKFFQSYLCGRVQRVIYDGQLSEKFNVNSSVPQGSKIGPLLFLIMINDLPDCITHCDCFLFADDLKICREILSIIDCYLIEEDLKNIENWCRVNKLELNISKCSVMTYTLKSNYICHQYYILNQSLNRSHVIKDLGVIFDPKLSFELHIRKKVNEAIRLLGFIKRSATHFKNIETVKHLFNTLIRPKLEYGSVVWNPFHQNKINYIERVQKKFVKYIARKFDGIDTLLLSYQPLLNQYEIISLKARRQFIDLLYIYKILNGMESNPTILGRLYFQVGSLGTRSKLLFYQPVSRVDVTLHSTIVRLTSLLNKSIDQLDPFYDKFTVYRRKCLNLI